jgi:DNA-binding IclR family transcriptional regulator
MSKTLITPQRRRRPKSAKRSTVRNLGEAYHSKAIGRALDVLECFDDDQTTLSLMEISQRIDLPESSLFRVLLTLESRRYLRQNADGSYSLTPRVLYGKARERADFLREIIRPYLRTLASRFNETASLGHIFEDRIQVLDSINALHEVRMINLPGRVLPPHCSSLGKTITAFQSPELIDRILEVYGLYRRTSKTIIERRAVMDEYELIRRNGYATDREEATEGGICFGVPIRIEGVVRSSISISIPASRMTAGRDREIIDVLLRAADEIAVAIARKDNR